MTSNSSQLGGPYSERRASPRYTFIATAEIIEPQTDTHISGRISEISRRGCYVDILNTLPKDTAIRIRITTDNGSFECSGAIIYVQENVGMGVSFLNVTKGQQDVLDGWLRDFGG